MIKSKLRVREAIRAAGIPHTIVCSYWGIGLLLSALANSGGDGPLSTGVIFGDENSRGKATSTSYWDSHVVPWSKHSHHKSLSELSQQIFVLHICISIETLIFK
jgi:hypothetical protein